MGFRRNYARTAAAILFLDGAFELARVISARPWPGTYPPYIHSNLVSLILSALWFTAAVFLILREKRPSLERLSLGLALASTLTVLFHGLISRVFGERLGLFNVFVAIVLLILIKKSFSWEPFPSRRERSLPH